MAKLTGDEEDIDSCPLGHIVLMFSLYSDSSNSCKKIVFQYLKRVSEKKALNLQGQKK